MSPLKTVLFAAAVSALAACATPASLAPGTTLDEARAKLGNPTGRYSLPGGGTRLQYSNQPFDQSVWNANFDEKGRLANVEQMMTDAAFARVRSGKVHARRCTPRLWPACGDVLLPTARRKRLDVPLLHVRRVQGGDVRIFRSGRSRQADRNRAGPVGDTRRRPQRLAFLRRWLCATSWHNSCRDVVRVRYHRQDFGHRFPRPTGSLGVDATCCALLRGGQSHHRARRESFRDGRRHTGGHWRALRVRHQLHRHDPRPAPHSIRACARRLDEAPAIRARPSDLRLLHESFCRNRSDG